jgi:cytochrome c553
MLIGAAIGIAVVVPLGAYAFVHSGLFNVGASDPHTKLTFWVTHETMIHSVRRHAASVEPPRRLSVQRIVGGFCSYETHCVACHGAPAIAREQWVGGLMPQPPYLVDATSQWTPDQLFWIAKNGIKMTAMPSWRDSMSDRQIWDVVGFLEALRQLPPQTYGKWRSWGLCRGFSGPWPAPAPASTPPAGRARPTGATGGSAPSSRAPARP